MFEELEALEPVKTTYGFIYDEENIKDKAFLMESRILTGPLTPYLISDTDKNHFYDMKFYLYHEGMDEDIRKSREEGTLVVVFFKDRISSDMSLLSSINTCFSYQEIKEVKGLLEALVSFVSLPGLICVDFNDLALVLNKGRYGIYDTVDITNPEDALDKIKEIHFPLYLLTDLILVLEVNDSFSLRMADSLITSIREEYPSSKLGMTYGTMMNENLKDTIRLHLIGVRIKKENTDFKREYQKIREKQ